MTPPPLAARVCDRHPQDGTCSVCDSSRTSVTYDPEGVIARMDWRTAYTVMGLLKVAKLAPGFAAQLQEAVSDAMEGSL